MKWCQKQASTHLFPLLDKPALTELVADGEVSYQALDVDHHGVSSLYADAGAHTMTL